MSTDAEKIEHHANAVNAPVEWMAGTSEKLVAREVDGALAFLRDQPSAEIAELDERKLIRKIDWLVMPILFGIYVLQYIDKSLSM
jgi:hypothetical protein